MAGLGPATHDFAPSSTASRGSPAQGGTPAHYFMPVVHRGGLEATGDLPELREPSSAGSLTSTTRPRRTSSGA